MPLQKKMEFEGKDIAEAISKACKTFNVSQENLDIEVLTTGTSGIFGLCRQKARLRVAVKSDADEQVAEKTGKKEAKAKGDKGKTAAKKQEVPAADKPKAAKKQQEARPSAAPVAAEDDFVAGPELLADVEAAASLILELMGFPSDIAVSGEKENVTVNIKGDYVNVIVDQNGRVLDSLQYLVRKIIAKKYSEKAIISLDAGDFRAARIEELKKLAAELAEDVKQNGKTKSIPALNPSERRVVHLVLQDDKEIRSRSVGQGLFKKVLIYRPGSKDRKGPARKRKGAKNKKQ